MNRETVSVSVPKSKSHTHHIPSPQAQHWLDFGRARGWEFQVAGRAEPPTEIVVTVAQGPNYGVQGGGFAVVRADGTVGAASQTSTPAAPKWFQSMDRNGDGDITPREVMIVIDRSGSMDGQPLAQAKAVASAILDTLSDRDSFNIVAFASGVEAMADTPVRGDRAGKQRGLEYLKILQSGGGTEMEQGVSRMLTTSPGSDRIRVVYFLTDGFVGNDDVVVGTLLGAAGAVVAARSAISWSLRACHSSRSTCDRASESE